MVIEKKALLVDLCDTLYPENTTIGFVNNLVKNRYILSNSKIFKLISKVLFIVTRIDLLRKIYVGKLNNYQRDDLLRAAEVYLNQLKPNTKILKIIEQHRKDGFDLILVSASLDPIVEMASRKFGFTSFYSSKLGYDNECRCTGILVDDLLGNKLNTIKEIKKNYTELIFLTDNKSDYSCEILCEHFYAVVPKNKKRDFWNNKKINLVVLDDDE